MFISKQKRIDVRSDSISTALLKKSKNECLSKTTLNKLVKIANVSVGLTKAEARNVFTKNEPIEKSNGSIRLSLGLKMVISQVSNPKVKNQVEGFIRNCNSPSMVHAKNTIPTHQVSQMKEMNAVDFVEAYSRRIGRTIGEGGEAIVVEDRDNNKKVIKIFSDDIGNNEIVKQLISFRKFYGENSAHILSKRAIQMDKIKGNPLSQVTEFPAGSTTNFMSLIKEMNSKGCPPSDLSENNFLYNKAENKFLPVDISISESNKIDKNGLKYILNYISSKTPD